MKTPNLYRVAKSLPQVLPVAIPANSQNNPQAYVVVPVPPSQSTDSVTVVDVFAPTGADILMAFKSSYGDVGTTFVPLAAGSMYSFAAGGMVTALVFATANAAAQQAVVVLWPQTDTAFDDTPEALAENIWQHLREHLGQPFEPVGAQP